MKVLAEYKSTNEPHFLATVDRGIVTVSIRNCLGTETKCLMTLNAWVKMIKQSRDKVLEQGDPDIEVTETLRALLVPTKPTEAVPS